MPDVIPEPKKLKRVSKPPRPDKSPPSAPRHPSQPPILRWLTGGAHLHEPQKSIFAKFEILAHDMVSSTPAGPEQSAGLRKLLEAKDCFVRASFE